MNILENNFEIEDLGVQEIEVYDIEVENNHNFFGNDILIHNSGYYTIAPIMNEIIKNNPNKSINDYVDIANKFELKFIDPVIQKSVDIATTHLNARRPEVIGAKREIIADTCIYLQKKRYLARVRDSEGTRYPESEPHMKYMGVELARSSTTDWVKKHLSESLNILFDKFKNKEIEKHYIAYCYGIPIKKQDRLESFLFKDNKKSMVYISDTFKKGYQKIITNYTVLKVNKDNKTCILDVNIETGKTHQIRAHLAHIELPIIGDGKYGINDINKNFGFKTQQLCSYKLIFNFKNNNGILDYLTKKQIVLNYSKSFM